MLMANARQLAESIVTKTGNEKDGLHFLNLAQELLTALILFVVCHAPHPHRSLNSVRYLAADLKRLKESFDEMKKSRCVGGFLSDFGSQMESIPEREFGSVLTTLNQHLAFLADPIIADHLSDSNFDLRAATRNTTTYCILPAKLMKSYAAYMRLVLNAIILVKKDEGLDESNELMLILDEVGNLGQLTCLQDAVTVGRGMGLRLFFVLQALSQLEANFEKAQADSIIASCDLKIYLNVGDLTTAKVVSESAGKTTVTAPSYNDGRSENGGGTNGGMNFGSSRGRTLGPQARDLFAPDEVMRSEDTAYIFITGKPPLIVNPIKYYEDRTFAYLNGSALLPTASLYSWVIALVGLYFAFPVAWDTSSSLRRLGHASAAAPAAPESATPNAEDPAMQPIDSFIRPMTGSGFPVPPASRWPSVAICPRCKARYDLDGYKGQLLKCEDCSATFRVPKR
jgi:type IV secretion system protein VirD4